MTYVQCILIIFIAQRFASNQAMITYIYLNVDECWLTPLMSQQRFKRQMFLKYAIIPENMVFED